MTKIRALRKEKGMTAFELSRRTNVHPAIISRVENRWLVPGPKDKAALLAALGANEQELFDADNGLALK